MDIKERLAAIAREGGLSAVIFIGSSVRSERPADEYSDLDVIIACDEPEKWLYGNMPDMLGDVKISFVEPTIAGGMERRILYDGSRDVDILVYDVQKLKNAVTSGEILPIMERGYLVAHDKMGIGDLLEGRCMPQNGHFAIEQDEFTGMINDFWFHVVWAAKKILRGEIWVAAMCVNGYLKSHLLRVMEIDARMRGEDTWHDGRFMEKWAMEEDIAVMMDCFGKYGRDELFGALKATARLYRKISERAAAALKFEYPDKAARYAMDQLENYIDE